MKCFRCMWPEEMRCLNEHCDNLYDPTGDTKKLHEKCSKDPEVISQGLCSVSMGKLMAAKGTTFNPNLVCFKCNNKIDGFIGFQRAIKKKYDAGKGVIIDIRDYVCLECYDKTKKDER
jgi:hypothetical protein